MFVKDDRAFPEDFRRSSVMAEVKAKKGAVTLVFKGVKVQKAAFCFIHDEKMIGRLEKSFLGIPKQGITASNWNGRSKPKFASSLVEIQPKLEAKLKYF